MADTFKCINKDIITGEILMKKFFIMISVAILYINIASVTFIGTSQMMVDDKVIYVDDDNTQGPWDGSAQHPFRYIQDAINVSETGSIIFVYNGIYCEHVNITKSIYLFGERTESTIIDGDASGGVIEITGGIDIFIQNFTIQHGSDNTDLRFYGISIQSSEFVVVKNTVIANNEDGIVIGQNSKNCLIVSNQILNNGIGIDICSSPANLLYGNSIYDNEVNLVVYQSENNLITNNNIYNSKRNVQFFNSRDTFNNNYWGKSWALYPIIGKREIGSSGILIPWIKFDTNPVFVLDAFEHNPIAGMKTTKGTMIIEVYRAKMPITVDNFIRLSEIAFFDNLVFHRVINDFVIQGGGYYANGTNKESPFGPINLEINPEVNHVDGAISMARTSDPNSATSQFFICDGPQQRLDGNYSAFGKVIVGIDVLRAIASVETKTKYGVMRDWPVNDIIIDCVEIVPT